MVPPAAAFSLNAGSINSQIFSRVFSAIVHDVEADFGALGERGETSLLNGGDMNRVQLDADQTIGISEITL